MEKQTIQGNFEQALSEFDFDNTLKIIELLKWSEEYTIERIQANIKSLFESILDLLKHQNSMSASSGGFKVSVNRNGNVFIEFTPLISFVFEWNDDNFPDPLPEWGEIQDNAFDIKASDLYVVSKHGRKSTS